MNHLDNLVNLPKRSALKDFNPSRKKLNKLGVEKMSRRQYWLSILSND